MQRERLSREEFLAMFREDVIRLSRYIPWFEEKCGSDVSQNYTDGDLMNHTLSFPVYDSILLAFLNDASTTVFMEQNYHYFYSRNRIKSYEDELRLIETADIMHMDVLQCILSRYVFGGMTKAYLWRDGVEHRVFLAVLKKARYIIEFWSQPLIIEDEISPDGEIMNSEPEVQAEDDGFSDEFIAQIMAEYEAEDAAAAAIAETAAEPVFEEEALETVAVEGETIESNAGEDDGFSDEFIAQIMAEYAAEDAAKAAAAAETVEAETAVEEVVEEAVEETVEEVIEEAVEETVEEVAEEIVDEVEEAEEAVDENLVEEISVDEEDAEPTEDIPVEEDIMQEVDELTVEEEIVSE